MSSLHAKSLLALAPNLTFLGTHQAGELPKVACPGADLHLPQVYPSVSLCLPEQHCCSTPIPVDLSLLRVTGPGALEAGWWQDTTLSASRRHLHPLFPVAEEQASLPGGIAAGIRVEEENEVQGLHGPCQL